MSRLVYVNGRFARWAEARVHAEDRGFQFGDAVYEVCEVRDGRLVDERRHLDRLERSLGELGIPPPMSRAALRHVLAETVRRNRVHHGVVYLQVTRGVGRRDFHIPDDPQPTLVCLARRQNPAFFESLADQGIAVVTMPETRWARCDIKTVMLLPAVLAKDAACRAGAREAWFVDRDGLITEGASSNAWIVTAGSEAEGQRGGQIVTRHLDPAILPGVTRATVLDVVRAEGLAFAERAFTLAEAMAAREAFITAATSTVMPVVRLNGAPIGDGKPGPVVRRLRARFHDLAS